MRKPQEIQTLSRLVSRVDRDGSISHRRPGALRPAAVRARRHVPPAQRRRLHGRRRGQRRTAAGHRCRTDPGDVAACIARDLTRFVAAVEQRNPRAESLGTSLYETLLRPVEETIRGARAVCLIPERWLWHLPFHLLAPRGGAALLERIPVFYAPSIAVLAASVTRHEERRSEQPALLAFANPVVDAKTASLYRALEADAPLEALPETENEVRAIASLYGPRRSRIRIGRDATETILKRDAAHYDVLHIATHGLVHDRAPMFSSLVLAASPAEKDEDGLLEAREIAGLELNADLAVLSACNTGKAAPGAGIIALSWAFLAAGCPTTVVSQWLAESAATEKLMVEFHRQLVAGKSKAEALRHAQLALRRDPRYRHPFYWGSFIVLGAP